MPQKRSLIINKLKTYISEQIVHTLNRFDFPLNEFSLSPPKQDDFGDLSTNVAMMLISQGPTANNKVNKMTKPMTGSPSAKKSPHCATTAVP